MAPQHFKDCVGHTIHWRLTLWRKQLSFVFFSLMKLIIDDMQLIIIHFFHLGLFSRLIISLIFLISKAGFAVFGSKLIMPELKTPALRLLTILLCLNSATETQFQQSHTVKRLLKPNKYKPNKSNKATHNMLRNGKKEPSSGHNTPAFPPPIQSWNMGLQWSTEHNCDSGETTTKSTEQLDLCHRWQQTNHKHPYLNMCPGPTSLFTRRVEQRWDLVQPHDGENRPPPASPLTALLPLPARGHFLTPPHSFSASRSFVSSAFLKIKYRFYSAHHWTEVCKVPSVLFLS